MQLDNRSARASALQEPTLSLGTAVAADTAVALKLSLHGAGRAIRLPRNGTDAEVLLPETGDGHAVFRLALLIVR